MIKRYKLSCIIFIYFIFCFVTNIWSFSLEGKVSDYASILFLDFQNLQNLGFEPFNPQFIITFLIYMYIICGRMFSIIHENASFKSLYLLKYSRRDFIKYILIEAVKHYLSMYLISVFSVIVLSTITITTTKGLINDSINISIYLFRIISNVCIFNIGYEIICISSSKNNYIIILYCFFIGLIFLDLFSKTTYIVFSNVTITEIKYVVSQLLVMLGVLYGIRNKYLKMEDLFND